MAEIPRHPEVDGAAATQDVAEPKARWLGYAIGAIVALVVILVAVLHLTGAIGAGGMH